MTSSRIIIKDRKMIYCSLYIHHDGYVKGVGQDLLHFLDGMKIVNGLSCTDGDKVANGLDDLAAQLVMAFKTDTGNVYLQGETEDLEDYTYIISLAKKQNSRSVGKLNIKVFEYEKEVFSGNIKEYSKFVKKHGRVSD